MTSPPGLAEPCPQTGKDATTHATLVEAAMEADARKAAAQWAETLETAALETAGQVEAECWEVISDGKAEKESQAKAEEEESRLREEATEQKRKERKKADGR